MVCAWLFLVCSKNTEYVRVEDSRLNLFSFIFLFLSLFLFIFLFSDLGLEVSIKGSRIIMLFYISTTYNIPGF